MGKNGVFDFFEKIVHSQEWEKREQEKLADKMATWACSYLGKIWVNKKNELLDKYTQEFRTALLDELAKEFHQLKSTMEADGSLKIVLEHRKRGTPDDKP